MPKRCKHGRAKDIDVWNTRGVAPRNRTGVRGHNREVKQRSRAWSNSRAMMVEEQRNHRKSNSISSGHDKHSR